MNIRPYIIFKGDCQDAIDLYEAAFNSKVTEIMRFKDVPADPENTMITEDMSEWVMMAELPMGDNFIRLSDTVGEFNDAKSERISISVESDEDMIKKAFNVLSEDGNVGMPLQKTFFSTQFGIVHDKFGVVWTLVAV